MSRHCRVSDYISTPAYILLTVKSNTDLLQGEAKKKDTSRGGHREWARRARACHTNNVRRDVTLYWETKKRTRKRKEVKKERRKGRRDLEEDPYVLDTRVVAEKVLAIFTILVTFNETKPTRVPPEDGASASTVCHGWRGAYHRWCDLCSCGICRFWRRRSFCCCFGDWLGSGRFGHWRRLLCVHFRCWFVRHLKREGRERGEGGRRKRGREETHVRSVAIFWIAWWRSR